jgi:transposase
MGMARYLVEAHLLEGRPVAELAASHGVHRSWIYKLIARYRADQDLAGLRVGDPRAAQAAEHSKRKAAARHQGISARLAHKPPPPKLSDH